MYLSSFTGSRDNNFNLIRFIAAVLVIVSHMHTLSLGPGNILQFERLLGKSLGDISVDVFFICSGFLIVRSFLHRKNNLNFVISRVFRIFPGLLVVVFFLVFIVGPFFTDHSIIDYLTNVKIYKFLGENSTLLFGHISYHLPGVFINNPYEKTVNGSLWTLIYEVKMYAYLFLGGVLIELFAKNKKRELLLKIAVVIVFLSMLTGYFFLETKSNRVFRLGLMFFTGVLYYVFKEKIILKTFVFIVFIGVLLIMSLFDVSLFNVAYVFILPYIMFYLVYVPKGWVRKFNLLGDYSYGIYIYAFPVQQSVVALMPGKSIWIQLIVSLIITLFFAFLSWEFVESKALKFKNKLIFK